MRDSNPRSARARRNYNPPPLPLGSITLLSVEFTALRGVRRLFHICSPPGAAVLETIQQRQELRSQGRALRLVGVGEVEHDPYEISASLPTVKRINHIVVGLARLVATRAIATRSAAARRRARAGRYPDVFAAHDHDVRPRPPVAGLTVGDALGERFFGRDSVVEQSLTDLTDAADQNPLPVARSGVVVPYSTRHRFAVQELGLRKQPRDGAGRRR